MRRDVSLIVLTMAGVIIFAGMRDSRGEDAVPQPTEQQVPSATQPATQGVAPTTQTPEVPKPAVTILGSRQAQSVLGKEVRSAANEDMGRIVDVVVDSAGQVRAAVIDFGGFLGVGSRKIAVDWNALHFPPASDAQGMVTLELTRDQVKAAPEYKDKQTVIVLGAAGSLQSLAPE
jgi:hypothetical protein